MSSSGDLPKPPPAQVLPSVAPGPPAPKPQALSGHVPGPPIPRTPHNLVPPPAQPPPPQPQPPPQQNCQQGAVPSSPLRKSSTSSGGRDSAPEAEAPAAEISQKDTVDIDELLFSEVHRISALAPNDFRAILDIPPNEQLNEKIIKTSFRRLMKILHPDKRTSDGETRCGGRDICAKVFEMVQKAQESALATASGKQVGPYPASQTWQTNVASQGQQGRGNPVRGPVFARAKAPPAQGSTAAAMNPNVKASPSTHPPQGPDIYPSRCSQSSPHGERHSQSTTFGGSVSPSEDTRSSPWVSPEVEQPPESMRYPDSNLKNTTGAPPPPPPPPPVSPVEPRELEQIRPFPPPARPFATKSLFEVDNKK